jgi:hypothetical protein
MTIGLKPGMEGFQGSNQMLTFSPSPIEYQPPFFTNWLFLMIPFHSQEAKRGRFDSEQMDLQKLFLESIDPKIFSLQ